MHSSLVFATVVPRELDAAKRQGCCHGIDEIGQENQNFQKQME